MKNKIFLPVIFLTFFLTSFASAASGLADKVKEHTLSNGLKLLMIERHGSPTVAAWIRYRVGSADERSDERGIAHLLEHMLFKGTTTLGTKDYAAEKPLLEKIEDVGQRLTLEKGKQGKADTVLVDKLKKELAELEKEASKFVVKEEFSEIYSRHGGSGYNAYTSKDGTTYLINMPANKLELWAAIESDRMKNPVLREFYTERDVVMEERRRSYEASPEGKLWESFISSAFSVHPFGAPIIGWSSDIENLTRSKAEGFLKRYYAPNNAIMGIVGDFKSEDAIALVEKYFGDIPKGVEVPPVSAIEPSQQGERRVEIIGDSNPELMIGFHKPVYPDPDEYVFEVIDRILSDGRTSRLYKRLVVEKKIAADVGVFTAPGHRYPNLFIIAATPIAPTSVQNLEKEVYWELERLRREPVSKRELEQILNRMEYEEYRSMTSNGGMARNLTEYEAIAGSWRYLAERRSQIAKVTPKEIMRVTDKYLNRDNRVVGFITKKEVAK